MIPPLWKGTPKKPASNATKGLRRFWATTESFSTIGTVAMIATFPQCRVSIGSIVGRCPLSPVQVYCAVAILASYIIARSMAKKTRLSRFGYSSYLASEYYCFLGIQFMALWGAPLVEVPLFLAGGQILYNLCRGYAKKLGIIQTVG